MSTLLTGTETVRTSFVPGWCIGILLVLLAAVLVWYALADSEYIPDDDEAGWDEDEREEFHRGGGL